MKIKQILITLITAVSLLSYSQPAQAIQGFYDKKADAKVLSDSEHIGFALTSADDADWFKWTNNTTTTKYANAVLNIIDPDSVTNYDLAFDMHYSQHINTGLLYTHDTGPNGLDALNFFQIPPGATIYLKVLSKQGTFSPKSYSVRWSVQNV
ncbi:hypothetical protein [Paenibacillus taiwanensis]|uniref:hypothetical protein n=1 Tax=Paenibacillus taiwanensis TaxID=401638 RepID=UPI000415D132|nr:hypothetical protein [Paenibacillus taiwanensis]